MVQLCGQKGVAQGDILNACPVFFPTADLPKDDPEPVRDMDFEILNLIVMTQSCDLVEGKGKVKHVMLCAVLRVEDFEGKLDLNNIRAGRQPAFHLLAPCDIPGVDCGLRIVDFRIVYSLPIGYVQEHLDASKHRRLQPPYREHLSRNCARFFMRVGLPNDITDEQLKQHKP